MGKAIDVTESETWSDGAACVALAGFPKIESQFAGKDGVIVLCGQNVP